MIDNSQLIYEADLQKVYYKLECESPDGEIFTPVLMKLKADLECESLNLDVALTFNWEFPIVLKCGTKVYNKDC